ncbi:protein Brevis radix-like 3 [Malus sylvestris]|uniref:protein Brevis radix-like 3 n=1 Tax=Malus sylvestris TaxID=3752 RepID=UPI0021AC065E|nr:protein Brevis radix-like 3 [Malus sylvestris]
MLKCIPCFKQLNNGYFHHQDDDDDAVAKTLRTKQAIKALTAQDMALKASGAYKNCKPCSRSRTDNRHQNYADSDANSESAESVVLVEEYEPKEWVAQVELGVIITFVSLPQRGNDLKRI